LWGARKTGKSTYLKSKYPDSHYIDLLDSDLFLEFTKRPASLREQLKHLPEEKLARPIIIDEVQKVPQLLDEVHKLIEDNNLQFILSGSNARKLKRGQANLLGGRAFRYEMFPLTSREIPNFSLSTALKRGLIPDHYLSECYPKLLKSYVTDYLNEEIRKEGLIRNLPAFSRFLDSAGFSVGEMINFTNIARECGVDTKTAKEYFNILVDTLIGYLIEPYSKSRGRQVITRAPKFYLFDTGVANQVAGRSIEILKGPEAGRSLENFILMELVAYKSYKEKNFSINYWRTKQGAEVDFVLDEGRIAIEVKISSRIERKDTLGLNAFREGTPEGKSILVCTEPRPRKMELKDGKPVTIMPVETFLEDLWQEKLL
jgi:uncharacterized protein